jgi:hypothetical protein
VCVGKWGLIVNDGAAVCFLGVCVRVDDDVLLLVCRDTEFVSPFGTSF